MLDLSPLARSTLLARLDAQGLGLLALRLSVDEHPPGAVVVREGEASSDLFLVFAGEGRVERAGLQVARLTVGSHFGELGLITHRARAATVTATTALRVARLTATAFDALCRDEPSVGVGLLQGLVDTLGAELTAVTDNLGAIVRERSLPRRTEVRVTTASGARMVPTGTRADTLLPPVVDGDVVVAALLDRRAVSLSTALVADCELAPLTLAHWEGQRVVRASTGLVLLEAAARVLPAYTVRLGPSLGVAQRVIIDGGRKPSDLAATSRTLAEEMERLVAADLPIHEELWGVDEAIDHLTRVGWHEAAAMLRASREPAVAMVSCGQVYAPRMGPLVPRTGRLLRSSLEVEHDALVLRHGPEGPLEPAIGVGAHESSGAAPGARDAMAREHERWLASLGMDSVGAFNAACVSGRVDAILRVAEGFHEKRIGRLADEIAARLPDTRVVCVAGPSSSGKTTFLKRLSVQLQVMGIRPVGISLDDYYVDRERTPRDEKGEFDFETIDAIDVPLLGRHLAALTRGECVRTARYDFRDGKSLPEGGAEVRLGSRDVLLLEGIHGLNPKLTSTEGLERAAMKVFIMPMTSLPFDRLWRVNPSDVRLLRRIVRDRHGRNHDAAATILRWPSVRAGERKHIFPFFDRADFVFDSSLVYELSALKVYAERYLLEVPPASPAYTTAFRLRQLIDRFVAIHAEHIPPTSILREFIGDSAFAY